MLLSTFQPTVSAFHLIGITMLMGIGMANVMAPCTDSTMGSLPRAKAGVGSAVNDTTCQMGGAIGVAVFGSLMAGHFTSGVATSLRSVVPADVLRQIGDNVGQAVGVANESPAAKQYAPQILAASKDAFVAGLHIVGSSLQLSRCSQRSVSQSSCRRGLRKTSRRPCRSSKANPPDDRRRSPCEAWPAARSAARRGHHRISVGDVRRGWLPRVSIEGVAARAGVAKATVYRRYPTLAPLLVDAVRVRLCLIHELPDTGDLRADLLAMMQPLIDRLLTPDGAVLAALMTERFREPELAAESIARSSARSGNTPGCCSAMPSLVASCQPRRTSISSPRSRRRSSGTTPSTT